MNRAVETNLAMIRHVAGRLGHLRERVVFLGGAAAALLITNSAAPDVRVHENLVSMDGTKEVCCHLPAKYNA